jgi:hypothetical protein
MDGIISPHLGFWITGNQSGVAEDGGQIISFRTNMLAGNVTDGAIALSIPIKHSFK